MMTKQMRFVGHLGSRGNWQQPARDARDSFKPVVCKADDNRGAPTGLQRYMGGLNEAEQKDVALKLANAGYTGDREEKALRLREHQLKELGIEPHVVRVCVLEGFAAAAAGPMKTITVVDNNEVRRTITFDGRMDYEEWKKFNLLYQEHQDGRMKVVASWEAIQDGGVYLTDMSQHSQVKDVVGFQKHQSKSLEDEVIECALKDMQSAHSDAYRLCVNELHNNAMKTKDYDGIIVADNCVKVVEVKNVVDINAAIQLQQAIRFMREAAKEGADDFSFARRADGSVKEIRGALGGLLVNDGQLKKDLGRMIKNQGYGLYLVNGSRFSLGSACHPVQGAPSVCE